MGICVGVCFLCYLIMMKQKALEKRLVSMRKSKEERDASLTRSSGLASLGPAPQMASQCGAPMAPPAMSQYGVLPMETQGSQYGAPMQSQGGAMPMGSQFGAPMQSQGGSVPMGSQFGSQPMSSFRGW